MDDRIIETLKIMKETYGDGVFYNITTVKNLMNDLAPHLRKERIQVANFLEMGGYFQLKYAEKNYFVVRSRLTIQFRDTFAVDETMANWVLNIFSKLLDYDIAEHGAVYKTAEKPQVRQPAPQPMRAPQVRPYVGNERRPLMTVPRPLTPPDAPKAAFTNRHLARRISADYHSAAVVKGGIVKATGPNSDAQCNTNTYDWRNIVAVSAGAYFTVGLRGDGTAVGIGRNDFRQRNVRGWTNLSEISAGVRHTVGLRNDGTLLVCGQDKFGECKVSHWRNIAHVVAGNACTFGIKKDGRVLVSGDNRDGDLQVSHLENVADIAYAGHGRILALLQDGTLARVGRENHMRKNFSAFKGIRQISAAQNYFAALFENGTVRIIAYFWQDSGVEAVTADWRDIVAIAAGQYHILGWKSDGTLKAGMLHPDFRRNKGQLNVDKWEM